MASKRWTASQSDGDTPVEHRFRKSVGQNIPSPKRRFAFRDELLVCGVEKRRSNAEVKV